MKTEKEKFIEWFEDQANAKYLNHNFPNTVCSFMKERLFDVVSDDFFKDLNDFIEIPKIPNSQTISRRVGHIVVSWDKNTDQIFLGSIQEFKIVQESRGFYSLKNNNNFSICSIKFKNKNEAFEWFLHKLFLG